VEELLRGDEDIIHLVDKLNDKWRQRMESHPLHRRCEVLKKLIMREARHMRGGERDSVHQISTGIPMDSLQALEAGQPIPGKGSEPTREAEMQAESPGTLLNYSFANDVVLHEKLGDGAFGEVYRGEVPGTGQAVAVKFILTGAAEEILDEARLMSLTPPHPNLVAVLGVCHDPCSVIMHLVPGAKDGVDYLKAVAPVGDAAHVRAAVSCLWDVSKALAHLHHLEPPMLHRDLAARNVLCSSNGVAYLSDFGLSVLGSDADSLSDSCDNSDTFATAFPYLRAPPEFLIYTEFTTKSDTFMFGLLLWEMVHGAVPFADQDGDKVMEGLMRGTMQPVWSVEGEHANSLKRLMEACMYQDPVQRPSMAAAKTALRQLYKGASSPLLSPNTTGM